MTLHLLRVAEEKDIGEWVRIIITLYDLTNRYIEDSAIIYTNTAESIYP